MNYGKLFLISLLFSTIVFATDVTITRRNSDIEFIDILFVTATFGEYTCLCDFIENSKFEKFIKAKSIDLDINSVRGSNNIDYYEKIIDKKIVSGNFDYVIIIDEASLFSNDFYENLKKTLGEKLITISHSANADIRLFVDFNRFFTLLNILKFSETYNVYYLHNKDNPIDQVYYNILNSNTNKHFNIHDIQICFIQDIKKMLDKLKKRQDVILISNLDILYDEVSGKTLNQDQALEIINEYPILNLTITHNKCNFKPINSAFYLLWDYKEIGEILDNIIIQRRSEEKHQIYILSSKFNVNLSLDNNVLKSPDVKKLKTLLEFIDDVIIKK